MTSASATRLTVEVPAGLAPGAAEVVVEVNGRRSEGQPFAVVDPLTVLETLEVGRQLDTLALSPDGQLWGLDSAGNALVRLSAKGEVAQTIPFDGPISGLAIDQDGRLWTANVGTALANRATSGASVFCYDARGNQLARYDTGHGQHGIAAGADGTVWVTNSGTNTVTRIVPGQADTRQFAAGTGPGALVVDASGRVWIANPGAGMLTRLKADGTMIDQPITTSQPQALALDPQGNLWVTMAATAGAANSLPSVWRFPAGSLNGAFFELGAGPRSIAFDHLGNPGSAYGMSA